MPVLHVLAGPNGSGKTTYVTRALEPVLHLEFVNADLLAAAHWPGAESEHAYDASRLAAQRREVLFAGHESFITETVFSHESKLALVREAVALDYLIHLHVILVPVELSVRRVVERVARGGHTVPEHKIRERYARLWDLVAPAIRMVQQAEIFDNSRADRPFRKIGEYQHGIPVGPLNWPVWTPAALVNLGA